MVGLAVLGLEAVLQRRASLVAALFGGVLVSFINPYGPRLYTELFRTLGDSSLHFRIQEWLPLTYSLPTLLFLCYAVALFWFMERHRLRAVASVPVALFAAALYTNRNAPLFVVSAVRKFETYVAQLGRKVPDELHRGQRVVLAGLILGPLILAGYGVVSFFTPSGGLSYPKQEVAYLQQHPCPGNLFNDYNFGGYLIWQLPGKPVYIDGRMPSWRYRGTDYYANASRIYTDAAFREKQFKRYSIQCVLISRQPAAQQHTLASLIGVSPPKQVSLEATLERSGWRAIAGDQSSVLLER